ncbi:probable 3-hydroxyisobutyrate dehydrogenase, mitochondrial [Glycine soja]|uniref:probable 3-hydroxyisobutyrate dehydrogenase, mitochondrial n=1 Tax=Glycine soja TaxID=3848 RepID=UPI00103FB3F6|nr:probable 3-hydroxyisobutyrate dehydrogenase, mitochondrial [Glycine soja]
MVRIRGLGCDLGRAIGKVHGGDDDDNDVPSGEGLPHLPTGSDSSAAKIYNNLALAVCMLGISEALALGQSLGVSASTLTNLFNCSSANCWSRYTKLCSVGHEAKDFSCAFRHYYSGMDEPHDK